MTREEALRELGIDAAATPEEARRAYLRGIKTRKPETDPVGFRRLREAYELLSGGAGLRRPQIPLEGIAIEADANEPEKGEPWFSGRASHGLHAVALRVRARLDAGDYEGAVTALGEAIDQLRQLEEDTEPFVPAWLPRGILALEAADQGAPARALYARLRLWLIGSAGPDLLDVWQTDNHWRLLDELQRLDSSFPPELRRAAVLAGLSGDEGPAVAEARRYAERDPEEARAVAILVEELPTLRDLFAANLEGDEPEPQRRKVNPFSLSPPFLRLLLFFASLLLLGFLLTWCPNPGKPANPQPPPPIFLGGRP